MRKRVRSEIPDPPAAPVNWLPLFHDRCILIVLAPYLSLADIIRLSCVNKHMYHDWVHHKERVDVLQLRRRIRDATGRNYTKKMPLAMMRKEAVKALEPISDFSGGDRFYCFRCQMRRSLFKLVNRRLCPYATCSTCLHEYYFRRFDYSGMNWIVYYVEETFRICLPWYRWPAEAQALATIDHLAFPLYEYQADTQEHLVYLISDLKPVLDRTLSWFHSFLLRPQLIENDLSVN